MHVSKYVTPPITLDNILCLGPRLVHCQTYTHKKWNFGFASLVDNYLSIVCTAAYIISQCHFLVQISYVIYLSTRKNQTVFTSLFPNSAQVFLCFLLFLIFAWHSFISTGISPFPSVYPSQIYLSIIFPHIILIEESFSNSFKFNTLFFFNTSWNCRYRQIQKI